MRALAVAVAALLVLAAPAVAEDVSAGELRALAERAGSDPAALDRLRGVDSVDGRPVDLRRALEGGDAAERAAALAAGLDGEGVSRVGARERAREVLDQGRFKESELPRPFRKPLEWLGDRARPVLDALGDAFDAVARFLPGGAVTAWLLLAAVLVAAAWALTGVAARRRAAALEAEQEHAPGHEDPAALERAAGEAERAGDWEAAVRLRFRAGVIRLDAEARTTGELSEELRSPPFDTLGGRFDAIAYGGDPAEAADAEQARENWPRVLEDARR